MHASSVAKILDLIVGNVNDKGLLSILPVIDILVQVRIVLLFPNLRANFHEKLILLLSLYLRCIYLLTYPYLFEYI